MTKVPREAFVPAAQRPDAYADAPLSIGWGQTISQPFIVAWMSQELDVRAGMKVLEVGTGSGYQTAILAELGGDVYSVEIVPELAARAQTTLRTLGYDAVHLRVASGYDGWLDAAPFDRILLTAAPPAVPAALVDQLADNGRLLGPVGEDWQVLTIVERRGGDVVTSQSLEVRFVPMR